MIRWYHIPGLLLMLAASAVVCFALVAREHWRRFRDRRAVLRNAPDPQAAAFQRDLQRCADHNGVA